MENLRTAIELLFANKFTWRRNRRSNCVLYNDEDINGQKSKKNELIIFFSFQTIEKNIRY